MDPLLKAGFIKNYIREKIVSQLHTGPRQWEGPGGASPASAFPPGPPCAADASPHHVPKPRFYWSAVRLIFIVSPKQLPGGSTARWWLPAADPAFGGDVLASGPHWGLGAGRAFVLLPSSWQHGGRSRPFLQVLWLNHEGQRGSPPVICFRSIDPEKKQKRRKETTVKDKTGIFQLRQHATNTNLPFLSSGRAILKTEYSASGFIPILFVFL